MTRSGSRTKRGGVKKGTRKTDKGRSESNEGSDSYNDDNKDYDEEFIKELWESQFGTSTIFSSK